ncbi:response regulator [bacterium]|nr:response regulator [bacterium]
MGKTILFIDDSKTMRKAGEIAVSFDNNIYLSAESGNEGVEAALKHHPDLIFVDAKLQDQSGYKVCYTLKSNYQTASIPLILMVNQVQPYDEDKGKKVGVDKVIEKPFDTQEIREIIVSLEEIVVTHIEDDEVTQVGKPEIKVEHIKPQEDLEEIISPLDEEMISISSLEEMLISTNTPEEEKISDFSYEDRITSDSLDEEQIDINSIEIPETLDELNANFESNERYIESESNQFDEEKIEEFSVDSFNEVKQDLDKSESQFETPNNQDSLPQKDEIVQIESIDSFFEEKAEDVVDEFVAELEPSEEMININDVDEVLNTNELENENDLIFSGSQDDLNSFDSSKVSENLIDNEIVEETIELETLETMLDDSMKLQNETKTNMMEDTALEQEEKDLSEIGNFDKDEYSEQTFEITSVDELLQGEIEEEFQPVDIENNEDLKAIDTIIEESSFVKEEENKTVVTSIDEIPFVDDHEQFMGESTPGFDSFASEEKTPAPDSFTDSMNNSFSSFDEEERTGESSNELDDFDEDRVEEHENEISVSDDSVFDKLESLEKIDEHKIDSSFDESVSESALKEAILESAVPINDDSIEEENSAVFETLESAIDDDLPALDDFETNETTEELLSNPPIKVVETQNEKVEERVESQQEKTVMDDSKKELVEEKVSVKLNDEQMKEVIKEIVKRVSKEVIEEIVWQVVPELAETIIREELDRLLNEKLD